MTLKDMKLFYVLQWTCYKMMINKKWMNNQINN